MDAYGPRLYGVALRLCGHRDDAEDLVQDVFLQAFRKWHTYRGDAAPGTWLHAIAARACKARARRKGGMDRRTPSLSQLSPWDESTVMRSETGETADAGHAEEVSRVQDAIATLPEHLRVPLVLKEVLGMSVEDTADSLGLARGTIKTRVHRARLLLRKALLERAPQGPAPAPRYARQVCLDLLKAKMDAMDRGGDASGFKVPQAEVCDRCRAVFKELDLVQDACARLGSGSMPAEVRAKVLAAISEQDRASNAAPPRRGRRPVRGRRIPRPSR